MKKNVVIGISGGIAVYKACTLVRLFKKAGYEVNVVMTEHATEFVSPLTFETLSKNPVSVDMFHRNAPYDVEHVSLAQKADLFVVCPATANVIGKFANGIADDMLSTTLLATKCPVVVCPAMNTNMLENAAVQRNIATLRKQGVHFVESACGELACGAYGSGRLAEPEEIFAYSEKLLGKRNDLEGKRILVTAGATAEKLDDVRCITNFSSGKMGFAIAQNALDRGANVTLVVGNHSAPLPDGADVVPVVTTEDLLQAVLAHEQNSDAFVMAAAPCDYKPTVFSKNKLKSDSLELKLVKTVDVAAAVGKIKGQRPLVIFAAETENGEINAAKKLADKNADFCVLNSVKNGAVFGSDFNTVTIVESWGGTVYETMSKGAVAEIIVEKLKGML